MKIDPNLTCVLKADNVDLTNLSDVLKSAVNGAVLRGQAFLDDDGMVTFVNPLTKKSNTSKSC